MRKLAILTFLTLDGVMQAPSSPSEDTSGGFEYGGWAQKCWDEVMMQVVKEAMSTPYDLLLGRTTYNSFADNFTNADTNNSIANKLNNATKYVVTSGVSPLEWKNSKPVSGDIALEVSRLKEQAGPLLQVHGSWQLIQTLLAHGLIDEFRLWTFPVIVGSGKRLFEKGCKLAELNLVKSETCSCGAVMHIYTKV